MNPPLSRNGKLALALVVLGGLALLVTILWIGRGPERPADSRPIVEPAAEPTTDPASGAPTLAPSRAPALARPAPAPEPPTAVPSSLPAFGPEPGSDPGTRVRARRALRPVVGWVGQRPDGGP